jgi:hypothetical protein
MGSYRPQSSLPNFLFNLNALLQIAYKEESLIQKNNPEINFGIKEILTLMSEKLTSP